MVVLLVGEDYEHGLLVAQFGVYSAEPLNGQALH